MSDATIVAGVQAVFGIGVGVESLRFQQPGTYNVFTGQDGAAVETALQAVVYDKETSEDNSSSDFSKQSALILFDSLTLTSGMEVIDSDDMTWSVQGWKVDPTKSIYFDIVLQR